jgi:hypothetical protein
VRLVRKIKSDQRTAAERELTSVFLLVPHPQGWPCFLPRAFVT